MTLSQLRNRIDALKRRFANELAIIKARRITEPVIASLPPADAAISPAVSWNWDRHLTN